MTVEPALQLGVAIAAILGFGMLHGASDLALVRPADRPGFLVAYAATIAAVWLVWTQAPALGLLLLLALSAVHCGLDDAPPTRPGERLARGVAMVAAPAMLHPRALAELFAAITDGARWALPFAALLALAGAVAAAALIAIAVRRRDAPAGAGRRRARPAAPAGQVLARLRDPPRLAADARPYSRDRKCGLGRLC